MSETPHELVDPPDLPRPVGFSHAAVAAPGRLVFVAGQIGDDADGVVEGGIAAQMDRACANVVAALAAAGAAPQHVVSMQIFATDLDAYRSASREVGEAYRRHFGRHYPAMALVGVAQLFEPLAMVEVMCTAVVPRDEERDAQS